MHKHGGINSKGGHHGRAILAIQILTSICISVFRGEGRGRMDLRNETEGIGSSDSSAWPPPRLSSRLVRHMPARRDSPWGPGAQKRLDTAWNEMFGRSGDQPHQRSA